MTGRLAGRATIITGGESGIGLATARLFVASGARVHLVGLDRARLAAAVVELDGRAPSGGGARAERVAGASVADVREADQVRAAIDAAIDRFGRIDVLFSNAGISGPVAPIVDYPEQDFRDVLDVHVLGAFNLLRYGLPAMRSGGSVIINSSVVGLRADPGIAGYATAKHAQVGLARVAAKECAGRGIRVNTIHPGPTDTPFQRAIEIAATGAEPAEAAEVFDRMIPLARHASPDEIARVVAFLASDEASFITGASIAVDGGMSV